MDGKEQPKKWPNTVAFQDEYTREFMASTKEVKDGYYLFKSKTGGYTMWFPKNAVVGKGLYEKHKRDFESLTIAGDRKNENITYYIDLTYERGEQTEDMDTNLYLLSSNAYTGYNGSYSKEEYDEKVIYFAKKQEDISVDDKHDILYLFFGYVKSKHSDQGVQFIYGVDCDDAKRGCQVNVKEEEKTAKMLMKSIKFYD
ncbi:hypothetical protein ACPVTF_16630 [Geobacillus icigianus]|uniref:Lipoprotein YvcA n=1 Tax=Geobacillus subterraneus TaxID=129338 RepID=A0A679FV13_9BACL|nr:hypothetical protein [Geobacillus subterraneus]BBW97546.1 putative lipoprotein YvcA [Geobacillus subterraneus]